MYGNEGEFGRMAFKEEDLRTSAVGHKLPLGARGLPLSLGSSVFCLSLDRCRKF